MWLEKLFTGVLRVLTPLGPATSNLRSRSGFTCCGFSVHFKVLPLQVLTSRQRRVIDALCVEPRFVPPTEKDGWEPPIIGTLERRPPAAPATNRPQVTNPVSPFAADLSNAERR